MQNNSTFVAYIDETGDEGFNFKAGTRRGSSPWLIIGAVVFRREIEGEQLAIIDEIQADIIANKCVAHKKQSVKPLHFSHLDHEKRKYCANRIGQIEGIIACVLIDKKALQSSRLRQPPNLYHYTTGLLLERISWYCRDNYNKQDKGDGSVDLIFSHRRGTDYDALCDYIFRLRSESYFNFAPNVLRRDQFRAECHNKLKGLQIADIVVSSYGFACNPDNFGHTEDAYRRYLMPCVYRHNDKVEGYGEKFFPQETVEEKSRRIAYNYLRSMELKLSA